MKFVLRWLTNGIAFYLAVYLVDSVAKGRFRIEAVWVAIVLAAVLALPNSFVRPFRATRRHLLSATLEVLTPIALNTLLLYVFIWAQAPLEATNPLWVILVAAFLTLLAGVLNWLIGFRKKQPPRIVTRVSALARRVTDKTKSS
ncbi:MAG: phage holin family protein [Thermoleophilia bacterium]|nr:phage holin family protein [Thermoleophilia bacterium]